MNKIIFIILFLITIITKSFSQSITEIGMNEADIYFLNDNICFEDSLYNGTKFIKGMLVDGTNYIYYFFNEEKKCFFIILYFINNDGIQKFIDIVNTHYTKNNNYWISYDEKYFISLENIDVNFPVFYIWSNKINFPKSWECIE